MHHSTDHNGSIPGKIGETSLLDRSKARPPADFDMSIFAKPKESSGPAALAKSVYNTSEYLKKLREEDPWPEQMPKPGDRAQDRQLPFPGSGAHRPGKTC
jgi:hypothetical protein